MQSMSSQMGIRLSRLTLNDGSSVSLKKDFIVVVTGPNNCGKSQCLRDIVYNFYPEAAKCIVVKDIEAEFIGSTDELRSNLSKLQAGFMEDEDWYSSPEDADDDGLKRRIDPFAILRRIPPGSSGYLHGVLSKFFFTFLNTTSRLVGFNEQFNRHMNMDNAVKYQIEQVALKDVFEDNELENKIHNIICSSFGTGIVLNRYTYKRSSFHYVSKQDFEERNDIGRPSFARWFEERPSLDQQGDGLVSFCNILVSILSSKCPLLLLDEPEAFLHAPQIRALARLIANETGEEKQIIISTHSHDLVQALIDFGSSRVTVTRINRKHRNGIETNALMQLDSDNIAELWQDPLLRTSDVLTSLFHHVAVIVEGDSDARFFRAMLDAIEPTFEHAINIRFFHCNGKDKIPKIAKALKAIGIPVLIIVDIDIIDDKNKFLEHIKSFGGVAEEFDSWISSLIAFVNDHRRVGTAADAKELLDSIFNGLDLKRPLSKDTSATIFDAVRSASAWSLVKRSGEQFFTRGVPYNNFHNLCKKAEDLGIIINTNGELENFCKCIEARKSEWLAAVLLRDLVNDPELAEARSFVKSLYKKCLEVSELSTSSESLIEGLKE